MLTPLQSQIIGHTPFKTPHPASIRFQGHSQPEFIPSSIPCWHRRDPDVTATRAKVLETMFPDGTSTLFIGPAPVQLLDHRLAQLKRKLQQDGHPQAADTPPAPGTLYEKLIALSEKYPLVAVNPELRDPIDRDTMTFPLGAGPITRRLERLVDSNRMLQVLYPRLSDKFVWNWQDDPPTRRRVRWGETPLALKQALGTWFTKPAEDVLGKPSIQALVQKPCVVDFSNVAQGNHGTLEKVLKPLGQALLPGSVITIGTTDYCAGSDTVKVLRELGFKPLDAKQCIRTKLGKRWLKRHRNEHGFKIPRNTDRIIPAYIRPLEQIASH